MGFIPFLVNKVKDGQVMNMYHKHGTEELLLDSLFKYQHEKQPLSHLYATKDFFFLKNNFSSKYISNIFLKQVDIQYFLDSKMQFILR